MSFYRVEKSKNYTTINNTICLDPNISWKAKGIFLYAMSRPDDWVFHFNDLLNHSPDGEKSLRSGLKELEESGYLLRVRVKEIRTGKFSQSDWTFFEIPQLKEKVPQPPKRHVENARVEKEALLSTEETNRVVVSEKKIFDRGQEKILNVSDVHSYAVKFHPDWSYEEIQEAWQRFIKSNQIIEYPFDYIEGIIKKIRISKELKDKKCKKTIVSIPIKNQQSNNNNVFYTEKDMSESPLALYARQNGLS